MKKRDIIIITLCIATSVICIALTFWGNMKNDGVITTDAFVGIIATLIGVCATIVVGFQIASFVKIHETERHIKEVKSERDKMIQEKEEFQQELAGVKVELSNAFMMLSMVMNDYGIKMFALMLSIWCYDIDKDDNVAFSRYKKLHEMVNKAAPKDLSRVSKFLHNMKGIQIPNDIEHYTEIMKLHLEIIEIIENVEKEDLTK